MLALRQEAGLTQVEFADALGLAKASIAHWEWSEKPPRAELLPEIASLLGVTVDDVLHQTRSRRAGGRPGPIGEVQKTFEEVRRLPRKQQRRIVETVQALVNDYKRKGARG